MKWVSVLKQENGKNKHIETSDTQYFGLFLHDIVSAIKSRRKYLGLVIISKYVKLYIFLWSHLKKLWQFVNQPKTGVNTFFTWYNSNRIGTPSFPIPIDNWNLEKIRFLCSVLRAIFSSLSYRGQSLCHFSRSFICHAFCKV